MNHIVNILKSHRESENITKTALAKECGVSTQYVCMIESGDTIASLQFIKKASKILKLDLKKIKSELLKIEAAKIDNVFLD